jgi:hypothetical protein
MAVCIAPSSSEVGGSGAAALGFNLRRAGITVPLTDRPVVVTARVYEADLLHRDAPFELVGDTPDTIE